jgi:pyroglutamyl-peptidase
MAGADAPILLSGFGPFQGVERNPSGLIAAALADRPGVHSVVLPVSFRGAARGFDAALAKLEPVEPVALVGLGVHPGIEFRLERRACHPLRSEKPDLDGVCASALQLDGPSERHTRMDLAALGAELCKAGAEHVTVSSDAGGYVCERLYLHALAVGERLGIASVFLHVPPLTAVPLERQIPVVGALLAAIRSRA